MFDRFSSKLFAVLAGMVLLFASFLFGYGVGRDTADTDVSRFALLREIEGHIKDSALDKTPVRELYEGAARGMVRALEDPYSEYLDPVTYKSVQNALDSHLSGVGIVVKQEGARHRVVSVLDETPAARAGVAAQDVIVAVDNKSIVGLGVDEVARRIQGDVGSRVQLTVLRGDKTLDFTLVRETIERVSVEGKMVKDRLGLIAISSFTEEVGKQVREQVAALGRKGARGFILDLRGNGGGFFDEGVEVASAFLDGGRVVSYKERGKDEVVFEAKPPMETKLPLVVLVDEGTASASEIVAGAIQDRGRGIILGTKTFGKGSVTTIIPLSDGSALKLTTASFFTPSGRSIAERGITPDVGVEEKGSQLARAQQILTEMLVDGPVPVPSQV